MHRSLFIASLHLSLLGALSAVPVGAQAPAPHFDNLGIEEGLSQSTVYAIAQDAVGFMWFGTEDGLNRYDGREFRVFRNESADTSSLSSNAVLALLLDSRGTLWIGAAEGVDRYDPATESFVRIGSAAAGTRGARIFALAETADGRIWAASVGNGLYAIDPETNVISRQYGDEIPARVVAVESCDGENLWVGTADGLLRVVARGDSAGVRHVDDPRLNRTYAIHCAADGEIWFGSDAGLFHGGPTSSTVAGVDLPTAEGTITAYRLTPDGNGGLWVGTYGAGLMHVDAAGTVTSVSALAANEGGLADDHVMALFRDRAGTLWVGSSSIGISSYNPLRRRFRHVRPEPEQPGALQSANVLAVAERANGEVWLGSDGGLFRMDRLGVFERFGLADGLPNERIRSLDVAGDGTLWIGILGALCELAPRSETFRCHSLADFSSNFVMAVAVDATGGVWVGTRGDLAWRPPDSTGFRIFQHDPQNPASLSSSDVRTLFEDAGGTLWIGTVSGLNRFDPATRGFVRYLHDPEDSTSLSNSIIGAIMEDRRGRLWVGTHNGLNVLDRDAGTFRRIYASDGLSNDLIYGLLEDGRGGVWVATNRGLSRIEEREDDGSFVIRNYTPEDGLQSYEFSLNAHRVLSDGRLVFGGVNGFNIFHPDSVRENPAAPPVVLTGLSVLGRPYPHPVSALASLRLPHDESFFTFSYAALDFINPNHNRYMYRLDGLDDDWVDAGTRPVAIYTSVPPGTYTFRVRGSNGDGVWNEAGLALPVTITPPFWQTWWFRILALALVGALLAAAYRVRVRRLLEVERMRLRIAGDLHDDVGASLGSIILLSDMVRRAATLEQNDRRRLETIGQTAREMSADLREIVWIVSPEHDQMEDLVERLRHVSTNLLDGVPHTFEAPTRLLDGRLDMTFRRNVLLAFKEILHNVRKHADAGHVGIRVAQENGQLRIRVADDGRGFDTTPGSNGHGMRSLNDRATRLGGTLAVDTAKGKGTTVIFSIPIHANA